DPNKNNSLSKESTHEYVQSLFSRLIILIIANNSSYTKQGKMILGK
ncbi:TrsD, partial [Listeria innocua FSL S4-378]